jgi:L-threonylcarbamoyladenylate synthase
LETLVVDGRAPDAGVVARAVAVLLRGGLLVYATDTLYALGGRAADPEAGLKVRAAKGREEGKPLPLVAADQGQARSLAATWPEAAERLARRFWPGPLTLVVPAGAGLPDAITAGLGSVAVRVPALALARLLCQGAGPLISSSANRSGGPPSLTCAAAAASVGSSAELALDAGPGRPVASTVVDLTGPEPRLLRAGAVAWAEVLESL